MVLVLPHGAASAISGVEGAWDELRRRARTARSDGGGGDLRQLARGSSFNLAGSVVAAWLNLVLPVIITRSLAGEDAGLFFQATALFTILLNLGTVGADTGVLRSLPQALVLGRRTDVPRYLLLAIVPAIAFSVVIVVALVLASGPRAES